MIASLTGIISHKANGQLIIDVNGVGYLVSVAPQLEASVVLGSEISVRTSFIVREDAFIIFGFSSSEELQIFETLRSVNGVGPKLAMAILAQLGIDQISQAVTTQDDKIFSSVSGIGPKTAKLLTVALEGKVQPSVRPLTSKGSQPVLAALVGLGWPERQAHDALQLARSQVSDDSSEKDLLRSALNILANDRAQSVAVQ